MHKTLCFVILLLLFAQVVSRAQTEPYGLRTKPVTIKGLLLPMTPLPDSIKSYYIRKDIQATPAITGLDERKINLALKLTAFEYNEKSPQLILNISVLTPARVLNHRSRQDSNSRMHYWMEENITPKMSLSLQDRSGRVLLSRQDGFATKYEGPERNSKQEAELAIRSRGNDPFYASIVQDAYNSTLQSWSTTLRNYFDRQNEKVILYYPKGSDTTYVKNIDQAAAALLRLGNNSLKVEAAQNLSPNIAFFEGELNRLDPSVQKNRKRYLSSAMNLATIFRCLEDFEQARIYLRLLMKNHFSDCEALAEHIATMKSRQLAHHYFMKTGEDIAEANARFAAARLDSLLQQNESEGYIILKNKARINGTFLDLMKNYKAGKVLLKYEKRLNAPVSEFEYSIIDLSEIHVEGWDLVQINHLGKRYLAEILYQSPKITYCKALELPEDNPKRNKKDVGRVFLKFGSEADYASPIQGQVESLSPIFKDCPVFSRQVAYGYYGQDEFLLMAMDYEKACDSKAENEEGAVLSSRPEDIKIRKSKGLNAYLGLSSGYNNFSSALGMSATFRVHKKLFARLGIGIGFWGVRYAGGIKYDLKADMRGSKGWSLTAGYTHSRGGVKGTTGSTKNGKETSVKFRSLPVSTIPFSAIYNLYFNRRSAFYFELGYSIPFNRNAWEVLPGGIGDPNDAKFQLRWIQPGGIIAALGINIGLF
jgi:hypothetical protein